MAIFCARYFTDKAEALEIFNNLEQIEDNTQFSISIFQSSEESEWCVEILFFNLGKTFDYSTADTVIDGKANLKKYEIEELPNEDWVAKSLESLKPIQVGQFFIHGSHDRDVVPDGVIPIEIDAAQAFGTGHHESTSGCILEIARLLNLRNFYSALDIGTGTGLLSIVIAKVARIPVFATDIDSIAVNIAKENVTINQVGGFVKVLVADGVNHSVIRGKGQFDLIVANILANPLIKMAKNISKCVVKGGVLVLSGLQINDESKVKSMFSAHGLVFLHRNLYNNWVVLTFGKR